MFVEMTEEAFNKFKLKIDEMKLQYSVYDCTLPTDTVPHVHVKFGDAEISKTRIEALAKNVDVAYQLVAEESKVTVKREKPWDKRQHTVTEEIEGYITGENEKEEVMYE